MKRRQKIYLYLITTLLLIMAAGCGSSTEKVNEAPENDLSIKTESLEMPMIPDSIVDPNERASYAAMHYWEGFKFGRNKQITDTSFMEQSFSNYIALLAATPEKERQKSVDILLKAASEDKNALKVILEISDKYLYDPNSPLRDEEIYMCFLKSQLSLAAVDATQKTIASSRLEDAQKNSRGKIATDFRIELRNGKISKLSEVMGHGENLVMFYDSDCTHCEEIIDKLKTTQFPGVVKIIAIDITGKKELWNTKKDSLPKWWTVGFDIDRIEERELYTFKAMPTFYLLDNNGVVLLKDPSPGLLIP